MKARGIVVIDNVLSSKDLKSIQLEISEMIEIKKSLAINDNNDTSIRTDIVSWISEVFIPRRMHESDITNKNIIHAMRVLRSIPYELTTQHGFDSAYMGVPIQNQLGFSLY